MAAAVVTVGAAAVVAEADPHTGEGSRSFIANFLHTFNYMENAENIVLGHRR